MSEGLVAAAAIGSLWAAVAAYLWWIRVQQQRL